MRSLFARKPIAELIAEGEDPNGLRRVLGPGDLIMLAIGAVIGAGIFSSIGTAAAGEILPSGVVVRYGAGPALVISFILLGFVCGLAALCYAELASMIPQAGSAYAYSYATLGEMIAWIIGWDLILEYAVGNIAVAVAWGGYFNSLLTAFGINLPAWITHGYRTALLSSDPAVHSLLETAPRFAGIPVLVNIPAFLIVMAITWLLMRGVRESARANNIMVVIKLLVLTLFVVVGAMHIDTSNYVPFAPNGWRGIHQGAAIVFFAYIGFDAISTAAEETKNPQRNMPIGILGGLAICTLIYVIVGFVATGMVPYQELRASDPLAKALTLAGMQTASWIVSLGAVVSLTAVLLVFQYGQPRIFFAMARDGLFFRRAGTLNSNNVPAFALVVQSIWTAFLCLTGTYGQLLNYVIFAALLFYAFTTAGLFILRAKRPDAVRPYRAFGYPVLPALYIVLCCAVMLLLLLSPTTRTESISGLVLVLIGIPVFMLWRRVEGPTPADA